MPTLKVFLFSKREILENNNEVKFKSNELVEKY